jgi:hypothetical protein|eukprot:COSAG06_NODE_910_length_11598_cov_583.165580_9_plen_72_part_00
MRGAALSSALGVRILREAKDLHCSCSCVAVSSFNCSAALDSSVALAPSLTSNTKHMRVDSCAQIRIIRKNA